MMVIRILRGFWCPWYINANKRSVVLIYYILPLNCYMDAWNFSNEIMFLCEITLNIVQN